MDFEIREDRKPQGRKKLTREREAYFQLMQQGVSNKEACRIVGINLRTGKRWRNGRNPSGRNKAAPPIRTGCRLPAVPVPARGRPHPHRRPAAGEGHDPRDRRRAGPQPVHDQPGDTPQPAPRQRAVPALRRPGPRRGRRPRPKPGKIGQNPELRDFIQDHLDQRWSPEQICQALRRHFPDRPEMHVAHETIYQALYVQGRGELRRELARALRTGRARRSPTARPAAASPASPTPWS